MTITNFCGVFLATRDRTYDRQVHGRDPRRRGPTRGGQQPGSYQGTPLRGTHPFRNRVRVGLGKGVMRETRDMHSHLLIVLRFP